MSSAEFTKVYKLRMDESWMNWPLLGNSFDVSGTTLGKFSLRENSIWMVFREGEVETRKDNFILDIFLSEKSLIIKDNVMVYIIVDWGLLNIKQ